MALSGSSALTRNVTEVFIAEIGVRVSVADDVESIEGVKTEPN
jgi:hypothetical protein